MFGIGFLELCVIAIAALLFVGPKGLPKLMKQFGKLFVQVQRMTADVKGTFDDVVKEAERELRLEEAKKLAKLIEQQKNELLAPPEHSISEDSNHSGSSQSSHSHKIQDAIIEDSISKEEPKNSGSQSNNDSKQS